MVDAERLLAILGRITSRLRILEDYATQDRDDLLADRVRLGDLKYTFQTAIEACIDAAQHTVADQGLGVPASNADAFRSLLDAGWSSQISPRCSAGRSDSATCWSTTTPRSTTGEWSTTCSTCRSSATSSRR